MSREIEVLTALKRIEQAAINAGKMANLECNSQGPLRDIAEQARRGVAAMNDTSGGALLSAVSMTNPASQSSVQIEQAAKGLPRVTVKVYDADPSQAMLRAADIYDLTVKKYADKAGSEGAS